MKDYKQELSIMPHAGAGRVAFRPIFNLKKSTMWRCFRSIHYGRGQNSTKKYKGSFSGEHGDANVRGRILFLYDRREEL